MIFIYVVSLPPQPEETTTGRIMTTEVTTGNQFQSKGDNFILSPAVFGGVIAGSVLVVMVIILVTCLCIRWKRQDQAREGEKWDINLFNITKDFRCYEKGNKILNF